MNVPDWLWQGLVEDAIWTSLGIGVGYTWKHREKLAQRLRHIKMPVSDKLGLKDAASAQILTGGGILSSRTVGGGALTVTKDLDLRWNVHNRVSKDADLRWKVEAPKPSLARRLEELAAWYLHVS